MARHDTGGASGAGRSHDFTFWTGASGRRYVHTVYALVECPELPNANILLVRRAPEGGRRVVHVCRVEHDAPSLNLAQIRQTGAQMGADEVHVHLLGDSSSQRHFIEIDVAASVADVEMAAPATH